MTNDFFVRVWDTAGNPVLAPDGITLRPASWSAAAVGGPMAARVEATGSIDGLLALGVWLGYRVQIVTTDGLPVWWGHVDAVALETGGLERELSLREMANRVKVLYSQAAAGGGLTAGETAWGEDAASVAVYGKRELVHSASSSLTAAQAAALQARILSAGKTPQRRLQVGAAGRQQARIICRGDWLRLGDVYYQQLDGLEEHNPGSGTAIPLGLGFSSAYLGFVDADSKKMIHECMGKFKFFGDYNDLKIYITGVAYNGGLKTISSGDNREPIAYTSTFTMEPNDDLFDANDGLNFLATDDVYWLDAPPGNFSGNPLGAKRVKTTGSHAIEVSTGWNGGYGFDGPNTATIYRGNSITITTDVANEAPDGITVETVTAYGQRIYQSFALAANTSWTLAAVELRVRRVGSPADNLRIALYTDSSGAPGTLVEQVTIAGAALSETMSWVSATFANTAALSYGVTYGLLIDRTGAMDALNFYEVEIDDAGGYSRGALRLYDGAAYQAANGDLIFRCLGAVDTAQQVADVAVGAGVGLGPALADDSGLTALQFQRGDATALAIVDGLLAQGEAGGERLLVTVTAARLVRIAARPSASTAPHLLVWRNGRLEQAQGEPVVDGWLPAGAWVYVDDLLLTGAWAGLSPVFVERAEYSVGQGLRLETEDQRAMGALFGTQQG